MGPHTTDAKKNGSCPKKSKQNSTRSNKTDLLVSNYSKKKEDGAPSKNLWTKQTVRYYQLIYPKYRTPYEKN